MGAGNQVLSLRVPPELMAWIEAQANDAQMSKAAVALWHLEQAAGADPETSLLKHFLQSSDHTMLQNLRDAIGECRGIFAEILLGRLSKYSSKIEENLELLDKSDMVQLTGEGAKVRVPVPNNPTYAFSKEWAETHRDLMGDPPKKPGVRRRKRKSRKKDG